MSFPGIIIKLLTAVFFIGSLTACQSQSSQPVSISFDRESLAFPITVEEAFNRYKLSFRSPGYYYRKDEGREMSIDIIVHSGDYWNEHQPKEALYDRDVVSYVLLYDGKKISSDSVRHNVERLCHCKLTFSTDSLSDAQKKEPIARLMPDGGRHHYGLAKLSEDVTVGFRNKPNFRGASLPEVRFFYKQSATEIKRGMSQY
ncbi:hypothetical protein [Spirosoma gilvum]